jgi:hypothetical protein
VKRGRRWENNAMCANVDHLICAGCPEYLVDRWPVYFNSKEKCMSVLLVTYDLKKPGQDYTDFLNVVRSNGWARLSESSYAVDTNESPSSLHNKLRQHLDANDQLYIITLKKPHSGYGPKEANEWLDQHLPY